MDPREVARDLLAVAAFCLAAGRLATAARLVQIAADLLRDVSCNNETL